MMVCKADDFGWPRTCLLVRREEAASSWWRHVPSQRSASEWTGDPLGIYGISCEYLVEYDTYIVEYSGIYSGDNNDIGRYSVTCIIIGGKLSNDT